MCLFSSIRQVSYYHPERVLEEVEWERWHIDSKRWTEGAETTHGEGGEDRGCLLGIFYDRLLTLYSPGVAT